MINIDIEQLATCHQAAQAAAGYIVDKLALNADKKNLLLLSGGSSTNAAHWIAAKLDINSTNSTTLALIDERFGKVGHKDSNAPA